MGEKDAQLNHRAPYLFAIEHFVITKYKSLTVTNKKNKVVNRLIVFDWLLAAFL